MEAKNTVLATALATESEHRRIALRVIDEVLLDHRAGASVRQASLTLVGWLARPAEVLARDVSR